MGASTSHFRWMVALCTLAGVFVPASASGQLLDEVVKLLASDAAASDHFGRSVSVSGNTAVVGAWLDDDAGGDSGSAYVYVRSGGVWTQQQKLTASDAAADDLFGRSVSVSGETAVVGAVLDDVAGSNSGSAYVFSPPYGACCISNGSCETEGNCQENISQPDCQSLDGSFLDPDISCVQACVDGQCIPAVSE